MSLAVLRPAALLNINSIKMFLPANFLKFSVNRGTVTLPSYQKSWWIEKYDKKIHFIYDF